MQVKDNLVLTFVVVVLIGVIPVPFSTLAQGVVWIPEQAQLRAGTDGFIVSMEGRHGDKVEAGQVVLRLEDARLVTDAAKLRSQLEGLNADLFQAMQRDR